MMNVNPPKSRNMFKHKDAQCMSVLSSGKWLQIVKNSPKIPRHLVSLDAKIDPLSDHATIPTENTIDKRRKYDDGVEEEEELLVSSSLSPSRFLSKIRETYGDESEKMNKKVISLLSKTFSSQGTLRLDTRADGMPRFVFKLENQKDFYVASLSSNVKDQNVYMIHQQRGDSSLSSHLVGRIKVSTLYSGSSRIMERKFVLFSSINDDHPQRKKKGVMSKKVADAIKNTQSNSRMRCSWDDDEQQFQEPSFENDFATNLERLAIIVKQEEEIGGWGLKFLKNTSPGMVETKETEISRSMLSMNVVIPSGIHGGPQDGPLSLIERWKSQRNNCDCGGWDLGCSLTLLKGNTNNDLLELFIEGSSNDERPCLRVVNVHEGLDFVQFQTEISVLQSFSIALAFIHSKSKKLQELV